MLFITFAFMLNINNYLKKMTEASDSANNAFGLASDF